MRIADLVVLSLVGQVLAGGGGGKHHVHFRIHVPDVIKHHIHTKTVFIHVHAGGGHGGGGKKKMVPKKKETHHDLESHHEDWSSWSQYNVHGGHGSGHEHRSHHGKGPFHGIMPLLGHGARYALEGYGHVYGHVPRPQAHPHPQMFGHPLGHLVNMHVQDMNSHPVPPQPDVPSPQYDGGYHSGGLVGYSYPPQYAGVHQDLSGEVKGVPESPHNEVKPYSESYEEGYHKGGHSESSHLLAEDLKNFYDNKLEEGDFAENGYSGESFDNYKNVEDSKNYDAAMDHDGNNYHGGDGGYLGTMTDTR